VRRIVVGIAVVVVASGLAGCSSGDGGGSTKLTVFAASSLSTTFDQLKSQFERQHSGVDVVISYDSSTTLATQVTSGAPADVLATADQDSMQIAQQAGDVSTPKQFATNSLIIAVPPDNPGSVTDLQSLQHVPFLTCDPSVPCGAAAATMLQNAGVTASPKSYEDNDADLLTKIEQGEADAGIVYVSDGTTAGGQIKVIAIPPDVNVTNPYVIATVKGSSDASTAQQWVDFVLSPAGQQVLRAGGFGKP
jgi:molybdate transport system substrate-binding protein